MCPLVYARTLQEGVERLIVLVTGAAGMLGSALVPALMREGLGVRATDIRGVSTAPWTGSDLVLDLLDVRSAESVRAAVETHQPDVVIHLAAKTNLEECEEDPDSAYLVNTVGTKNVALACAGADIPLVYISTAGVFDGELTRPYVEFDVPNPINVYGDSKFQGEGIVRGLLRQYFIVRAGWMVGGGDKDHKFVARIVRQLAAGAKSIYAVSDRFGTPTYAPDFASGLVTLLATSRYGLYHMACHGSATRYDVAREILKALDRRDIELVPVSSEYFAREFPAPRPRSEMMRNYMLELEGMDRMRDWRDAISEYLHEAFREITSDPAWIRTGG